SQLEAGVYQLSLIVKNYIGMSSNTVTYDFIYEPVSNATYSFPTLTPVGNNIIYSPYAHSVKLEGKVGTSCLNQTVSSIKWTWTLSSSSAVSYIGSTSVYSSLSTANTNNVPYLTIQPYALLPNMVYIFTLNGTANWASAGVKTDSFLTFTLHTLQQ